MAAVVMKYLSYHFTVEIKEIDVTMLNYPDVVVCAANGFNFTQMQAEGFDNATIHYLLWPLEHSFVPMVHNTVAWNKSAQIYSNWLKSHKEINSIEDTYEYFSIKPRDYVVSCKVAFDNVNCFHESIEPTLSPWASGICFVVSPSTVWDPSTGTNLTQRVPGRFGSWNFVLKRPADASPSIAGLGGSEHFEFRLTHLSDTTTEFGSNIMANRGKITTTAIQNVRVEKLASPHGNCTDSSAGQTIIDDHGFVQSNYTYAICHLSCQAKHAMAKCNSNCIIPGFFTMLSHSATICDHGPVISCMKRELRLANCDKCLPACSHMKIEKQVIVSNHKDSDHFVLELFYESMSYVLEKSVATSTLVGVLGSFGGQMSVWLGFKLATVVQLVWYAGIWLFCNTCNSNVNPLHES